MKYNINVTKILKTTASPSHGHKNGTHGTIYPNETFTQMPPATPSSSSSDLEGVSSEPSSTPSAKQDENSFHYEVYDSYYLVVKDLHHFTEYTIEVSELCLIPLS